MTPVRTPVPRLPRRGPQTPGGLAPPVPAPETFLRGILALLLCGAAAACGPAGGKPPVAGQGPAAGVDPPEGPLLAMVESGAVPLWFELDSPAPALVNSPAEAALVPFEPWPHARHVAGMAYLGDWLLMAINREGVLVFAPQGDSLAYYGLSQKDHWNPYTLGAVFRYGDIPAVLLYGDTFFINPASGPPPPEDRVWGIAREPLRLIPLEIPAFSALPSGEGWNVEDLRLGRDGRWYYRAVRTPSPQPEIAYFCAPDLEVLGEGVSAGVFRNATVPYTIHDAPPLLEMVLAEADRLAGGAALVTGVVSPAFPGIRYYGKKPEAAEEMVELSGFYREGGGASRALAIAVFPDGRFLYGEEQEGADRVTASSLPPLPEGFVYTRIGAAGPAIIAAWEEQRDWYVGAAGFLIITGPGLKGGP